MKAKGQWTTKNGTVNNGFCTTSCAPNHKPKRARKSTYQKVGEDISKEIVKININGIGIGAAIMTFFYIPLDLSWQIIIALLFILSAIHVEVEGNE